MFQPELPPTGRNTTRLYVTDTESSGSGRDSDVEPDVFDGSQLDDSSADGRSDEDSSTYDNAYDDEMHDSNLDWYDDYSVDWST